MTNQFKVCKKCKQELPLSEYSKKTVRGKQGLQPKCKTCSLEETRLWREAQSEERLRDLYYKRTYGLSLIEFNTMLEEQNNGCYLCYKQLTIGKHSSDSACVDHDHATGKVRKILCNECNRGLGYFKDNPEVLLKAASYVTDNKRV